MSGTGPDHGPDHGPGTDPGAAPTRYRCELAWVGPGRVASDVLLEVVAGRFTRVVEVAALRAAGGDGAEQPLDARRLAALLADAEVLPGLTLPGFANAHSHHFHRGLRGRTHQGRGSFWRWRDTMYALAGRLDPDGVEALARALFGELVLAGFTSVGEFHYLHHQPGGRPYTDANELGHRLVAAARVAGLRLSLLDTCYLTGGLTPDGGVLPLGAVQRRFSDGDADRWAARVSALHAAHDAGSQLDDVVVGAAIHSVRAVPREQLATVADWARSHSRPLHVHVSEQPAENDACLAAYGASPTAVLAAAGALGRDTTLVHATHLLPGDTEQIGDAAAYVALCPTTERDLADGVGAAAVLADAGARLTLGSDSHAVVDAFEEARAVELDLRLITGRRGHLDGEALLTALTAAGQASLGFADAGRLAVGARADLVTVSLTSVRTAGTVPPPGKDPDIGPGNGPGTGLGPAALDAMVFAAGAGDVTDVVVDGRRVVRDGRHGSLDVPGELAAAIATAHGEP